MPAVVESTPYSAGDSPTRSQRRGHSAASPHARARAGKPRETPKPKATEKPKEPEKAKPTQEELALKEANRELSATLQLVTDFLQAANEGKYFDAARSLTGSCQRYFESELAPVHGSLQTRFRYHHARWDHSPSDGRILAARRRGSGGHRNVYSDNSTAKFHFDLLKTKEGWKLDLNVRGSWRVRRVAVPAFL